MRSWHGPQTVNILTARKDGQFLNLKTLKMNVKNEVFEEACKICGIVPQLPDLSAIPEELREEVLEHYKLLVVLKSMNKSKK